jgi:hypothetical protein
MTESQNFETQGEETLGQFCLANGVKMYDARTSFCPCTNVLAETPSQYYLAFDTLNHRFYWESDDRFLMYTGRCLLGCPRITGIVCVLTFAQQLVPECRLCCLARTKLSPHLLMNLTVQDIL